MLSVEKQVAHRRTHKPGEPVSQSRVFGTSILRDWLTVSGPKDADKRHSRQWERTAAAKQTQAAAASSTGVQSERRGQSMSRSQARTQQTRSKTRWRKAGKKEGRRESERQQQLACVRPSSPQALRRSKRTGAGEANQQNALAVLATDTCVRRGTSAGDRKTGRAKPVRSSAVVSEDDDDGDCWAPSRRRHVPSHRTQQEQERVRAGDRRRTDGRTDAREQRRESQSLTHNARQGRGGEK